MTTSIDPETPAPRKSAIGPWLLILGFGGGFALLVALLLGAQASPRSIEARLEAQPALGATIGAFRESYPDHYAAFLNRLVEIENSEGAEAADRAALPDLRRFIAAKSEAIASAPAAELAAVADAMAAVVTTLQRISIPLCARFVTRGAQGERLPEAALASVGALNALQFRAARHGEGAGRVARGPLGEADGAAWFTRIRALDPALAERLNGRAVEQPGEQAQCETGMALYRAAAELPDEQSANVTAHLVRQSVRSPAG